MGGVWRFSGTTHCLLRLISKETVNPGGVTVGSVFQGLVLSSCVLVLITEEKRKIYDRYGKEGLTGGMYFITNISCNLYDRISRPCQNSSVVFFCFVFVFIVIHTTYNAN